MGRNRSFFHTFITYLCKDFIYLLRPVSIFSFVLRRKVETEGDKGVSP